MRIRTGRPIPFSPMPDYGLKKITLLTNSPNVMEGLGQYINRVLSISANLGNNFAPFHSVEEANEWLGDQVRPTPLVDCYVEKI